MDEMNLVGEIKKTLRRGDYVLIQKKAGRRVNVSAVKNYFNGRPISLTLATKIKVATLNILKERNGLNESLLAELSKSKALSKKPA